ncbi:hypothetical protein ABZ845_01985 [Streptomyces sp. NPDC047022]|uniref:hypothetical protein n=1 Tax=Streptomyces sp. NPDC047022 TaxID=3155737 RepID=UPI0033DDA2F1
MRRRIPLAVMLCTVAALASPAPASADTSGGTPVTLTVAGQGTLGITVPTGTTSLGTTASSDSPQQISGQLGNVTVSDLRSGTAGWTVTANAVDFTGPQNISVSAPGSSSYAPGTVTTTGTVTATATNLSPLYPPGAVVTATGVSGNNTASWNPTISVTVPANALAGTYSSTVTHSVA